MSHCRQSSASLQGSTLSRQSSTKSRERNTNAIKVIARFRHCEGESCVEELGTQHVRIRGIPQPFVFDKVLGPETEQRTVFEDCIKSTIDGVFSGYNGCVMAYGQTGSGKSHTMLGPAHDRGVIPRIVDHIFERKADSVKVHVGYLEIYNERIRDLLEDPTKKPVDLKLSEQGGTFFVKGLQRIAVDNAAEVLALMDKGNRCRSTASTRMNDTSSRSHSLFLMDVETPTTKAKLVLVDLAGSEKVGKTGARGVLLEEAGNINKSLSTLGMVVSSLAYNQSAGEDANLSHVPFRDSKLTRILQDSFAGNSRTCLIVHCSPHFSHAPETISTLRFGLRAKTVRTQVMPNYVPQASTSNEVLKAQRELNEQLLKEQARLKVQHRRAVARRSVQRECIQTLKRELACIELQNDDTELFIMREVPSLRARIYSLNP